MINKEGKVSKKTEMEKALKGRHSTHKEKTNKYECRVAVR